MGFIRKLTSDPFIQRVSECMQFVCYLTILLYLVFAVLSCMGRLTFILYTHDAVYENAIVAEEDHGAEKTKLTVSLRDDIRVWADAKGEIGGACKGGLGVLFLVHTAPFLLALWLLSRVFGHIRDGEIFIQENASCLLWYGMLHLFAAVPAPLLKILICRIVTALSGNKMEITTGQDVFNLVFQSIAFIVAAYIIQCGLRLQEGTEAVQ